MEHVPMQDRSLFRMERNIAQCRVLLSVAAPLAVYLDPTEPILPWFFRLRGAAFFIDPRALGIMLVHLAYSLAILAAVRGGRVPLARTVSVSTWGDVLFGAAVALATEGTNSPFYVFFLFAVLAAGLRGAPLPALKVTVASLSAYVALIFVARPDGFGFYLTRAVYLAITGYLVGFLGRQRRILETNLEGLTRSLHDEYAQALAGVNLRVETCRQLIRRGRSTDAFAELTELQLGVTRQYDDLRAYVRSLQGLGPTPAPASMSDATTFTVQARFDAGLPIVEHALQIMLEGARNVSRHARARSAVISASVHGERLVIRIDDDGVGFATGAAPPWSIASRAAEVGGQVRVRDETPSGGQLVVELPTG
jgi:hypothetical protein